MHSCDSYLNFVQVANTSKKNLNENSPTAKAKARYKDWLKICRMRPHIHSLSALAE